MNLWCYWLTNKQQNPPNHVVSWDVCFGIPQEFRKWAYEILVAIWYNKSFTASFQWIRLFPKVLRVLVFSKPRKQKLLKEYTQSFPHFHRKEQLGSARKMDIQNCLDVDNLAVLNPSGNANQPKRPIEEVIFDTLAKTDSLWLFPSSSRSWNQCR